MRVDGYVQAVQEDLLRVAAVGDESTARVAEVLAGALESSLGRHLQEALVEGALELSSQLPHGRVEVRVAGEDPELVYVDEETPGPTDAGDDPHSARITLRLPESLKARLEAAAAGRGVSLNTWLVQGLARSVESRPSSLGRHRLTGYGRS